MYVLLFIFCYLLKKLNESFQKIQHEPLRGYVTVHQVVLIMFDGNFKTNTISGFTVNNFNSVHVRMLDTNDKQKFIWLTRIHFKG